MTKGNICQRRRRDGVIQYLVITGSGTQWINSNKLLELPGFGGVKTGITEAAGPCLASCYEKNGHCFIVILLQCKSMEARWEEV